MPNHFHAIVINVGAGPRVRPDDVDWNDRIINTQNKILDAQAVEQLLFGPTVHEGEHAGSPLHKIVQWFKTMPTNEYIRGVKQNGWPGLMANYGSVIISNILSAMKNLFTALLNTFIIIQRIGKMINFLWDKTRSKM